MIDARIVDPDQENDKKYQFLNQNQFATNNWVRYQNPDGFYSASTSDFNTNNYSHPSLKNAGLVCSMGSHWSSFYLAVGLVNPHGMVSQGMLSQVNGFYETTITLAMDTTWQNYGGNDVVANFSYLNRMQYADWSIFAAFKYDVSKSQK